MKLSPAQRKVLEVMADGAALLKSVPTGPTFKKLVAVGLIKQSQDGFLHQVYTITPKGREALK